MLKIYLIQKCSNLHFFTYWNKFEQKNSIKSIQGLDFFLGLVDPSRNSLASTAYFAIISSIVLGGFWPVLKKRIPSLLSKTSNCLSVVRFWLNFSLVSWSAMGSERFKFLLCFFVSYGFWACLPNTSQRLLVPVFWGRMDLTSSSKCWNCKKNYNYDVILHGKCSIRLDSPRKKF